MTPLESILCSAIGTLLALAVVVLGGWVWEKWEAGVLPKGTFGERPDPDRKDQP